MTMTQKRIIYISMSIVDIITHIVEPLNKDEKQYSLLLIGDIKVSETIKNQLLSLNGSAPPNNHLILNASNITSYALPANMCINTLSPNDFIHNQFDKQYDLGCLIAPSLFDYVQLSSKDLIIIATRLRDLFAKHSLIFTTTHNTVNNIYTSLGYNHLGIKSSQSYNDNDQALLGMQGWQFNLYNYKEIPDWLNSRFWANPENFNKYRW